MTLPAITAWIEELDFIPCFGVDPGDVVSLVTVAGDAAQRVIGQIIGPST
jgi:hypothetical protein